MTNSTSDSRFGRRAAREASMAAFDALPRELRDALNYFPLKVLSVWASEQPPAFVLREIRRARRILLPNEPERARAAELADLI